MKKLLSQESVFYSFMDKRGSVSQNTFELINTTSIFLNKKLTYYFAFKIVND